jgi:UDP-N-acetylmuramate dehydrogenase
MSIQFRENVAMASLTTMGVGGPARYFAEVFTENEAVKAVNFARENSLDIFILGGGSNIIMGDDGFPGLVIRNKIYGLESEKIKNKILARLGAGEVWDEFVKVAVDSDWAGVENMSGVPGSVGAVPVQNVGCYGQSVQNLITAVRAIDVLTGKIKIFSREDCGFGYRDSIFRSSEYGKYFITQVEFELVPGGKSRVLTYPDVEKYFAGCLGIPTLPEMRRAILEIRSAKGMVIMPEYESFRSIGSFFKNPVVPVAKFEQVRSLMERFGKNYPPRWFWELNVNKVSVARTRSVLGQKDGLVKLSAARLIEASGFGRGYQEGAVGISPKHSLAIINLGGAKARDIAALAFKIQSAVLEKFGVRLEFEAQMIGT